MKKLLILIISAVLFLNLTACKNNSKEDNNNVPGTTINIASMKGPTSIRKLVLFEVT